MKKLNSSDLVVKSENDIVESFANDRGEKELSGAYRMGEQSGTKYEGAKSSATKDFGEAATFMSKRTFEILIGLHPSAKRLRDTGCALDSALQLDDPRKMHDVVGEMDKDSLYDVFLCGKDRLDIFYKMNRLDESCGAVKEYLGDIHDVASATKKEYGGAQGSALEGRFCVVTATAMFGLTAIASPIAAAGLVVTGGAIVVGAGCYAGVNAKKVSQCYDELNSIELGPMNPVSPSQDVSTGAELAHRPSAMVIG